MGSKSSPSADTSQYAAIYNADVLSAQLSAQNSANSLQWSKDQYAQEWPYVQNYMTAMTQDMNLANSSAAEQQQRLENVYYPLENQYAGVAANYATPNFQQQQAGAAEADVGSQYDAARSSSLQQLESYGIDPSQTRYGALDLGSRITQAAATAGAGTAARTSTYNTGIGLLSDVVNVGRGYPSSIVSTLGAGTSSGSSGVNAGLNTSSTYGSLMGTPTQWSSLAQSGENSAANTLNTAFSNELSSFNASNQASSSTFGGIGSLIGGLGTAALLKYSDERLKEDIHRVGETNSGIPVVTFRYKHDPTRVVQMGVLAQDVEKKIPEAVHRTKGGIRLVDYELVA
jgi:hypothetical protein